MAHIDDPETQRANLTFIKASMREPLLSRDHEFELARNWREEGNEAALHDLVQASDGRCLVGSCVEPDRPQDTRIVPQVQVLIAAALVRERPLGGLQKGYEGGQEGGEQR